MNAAKKIAVYLMMLLVGAMPLITAVYFIAGCCIAEYIAFEKIEKQACKKYKVSCRQVKWIKKGKELTIDGKLFDVKEYAQRNDSLELTGLFDKEEDALFEQYKDLVNHKKENKPLQVSVLKIFFSPAVLDKPVLARASLQLINKPAYCCFDENAVHMYVLLITPPPRNFHPG